MKARISRLASGIHSQLRDALFRLLRRRSPRLITVWIDRALAKIGDQEDLFIDAAAKQLLRKVEW